MAMLGLMTFRLLSSKPEQIRDDVPFLRSKQAGWDIIYLILAALTGRKIIPTQITTLVLHLLKSDFASIPALRFFLSS